MNRMSAAITFALIQSLWQGAFVAMVLALALAMLRRATMRHAACCISLLAFVSWFFWTVWSTLNSHPSEPAMLPLPWMPDSLPATVDAAHDRQGWIVPAWGTGFLLCSVRVLLAQRRARVLRRDVLEPGKELPTILARAADVLGYGRAVGLAISKRVDAPCVVGACKPLILVPLGILTELSPAQVEALLIHELAHLQRGDHWINAAQSWCEAVLFYHPATWWISWRIRQEREHCCDDLAVTAIGSRIHYARALVTLERLRVAGNVALGSNGGSLLRRIQRLAEPPRTSASIWPVLMALLCMFVFATARDRRATAQPIPAQQTAPADVREPAPTKPDRDIPAPRVAPAASDAAPKVSPAMDLWAVYRDTVQISARYTKEVAGLSREVASLSAGAIFNGLDADFVLQMTRLRSAADRLGFTAAEERERLRLEGEAAAAALRPWLDRMKREMEEAGTLENRTIRDVTFVNIPENVESAMRDRMPNWIGQPYSKGILEAVRQNAGDFLGSKARVLLTRISSSELGIVVEFVEN